MEGFTEGGGNLGPCNTSNPFLSNEYGSGTSHTVESTLPSSYKEKQEFLPWAPVLGGSSTCLTGLGFIPGRLPLFGAVLGPGLGRSGMNNP